MTRAKQNGFTLIELLVVITIIGILAAIALPNYIKAKDKAKEAEVKSACHTIQIALERYATDHSGKYPKNVYGGDRRGWSPDIIDGKVYGCVGVVIPPRPPMDALVHYGYVESYPDNAFIDPGEGRTSVIFWTGGTIALGWGDPRFGYTGEVMGNCLNDPKYLWEDYNVQSSEVYMIYQWAGTINNYTGMIQLNTPNNPFYGMGGLPQWLAGGGGSDVASGQTINAFWAGEFFYRSAGDFFITNATSLSSIPANQVETIWDWPYSRINRYLLGGYGSPRTQGLDVIRLTHISGAAANNYMGYAGSDMYVTHPEFRDDPADPASAWFDVHMSTPECFGGGGFGTAPTFPYWTEYNREWMYGAPDGYKDGVIITLISGSDSQKFD